MFKYFLFFLILIIYSNNCMSFSKSSYLFGFECSSIKNYFEIDLLPINLSNYNSFFLNKYKNADEKELLLQKKILNITKHFLCYLKEIKTDNFTFINGFSFYFGYDFNKKVSIIIGKTYSFFDINVNIDHFNEFFRNNMFNSLIGSYRYSYKSDWIDLLKNKKNDILNKNFFPYTFSYKKNNAIILKKENLDINYSKICLDHIIGTKFFSNRKGFRFGFGIKNMLTSKLSLNIIFRYHLFFSDYKYIKFLNKNLLTTSIGIIYNF